MDWHHLITGGVSCWIWTKVLVFTNNVLSLTNNGETVANTEFKSLRLAGIVVFYLRFCLIEAWVWKTYWSIPQTFSHITGIWGNWTPSTDEVFLRQVQKNMCLTQLTVRSLCNYLNPSNLFQSNKAHAFASSFYQNKILLCQNALFVIGIFQIYDFA